MGEHDGRRRAFLKGAAGVGAVAGITQSGFAKEPRNGSALESAARYSSYQ